MTQKLIIITLILSAFGIGCSRDKQRSETNNNSQDIKTLQIQLYPAFNNSSFLTIDKEAKTIRFKVDTTKKFRGAMCTEYASNLDSFEKNTLIDSFYSPSFLDSIKFRPKNRGWTDGLSIVTIINRQNESDTVQSGNHYPNILSQNIISQISYISKHTNDTLLKTYVEDLKTYFQ